MAWIEAYWVDHGHGPTWAEVCADDSGLWQADVGAGTRRAALLYLIGWSAPERPSGWLAALNHPQDRSGRSLSAVLARLGPHGGFLFATSAAGGSWGGRCGPCAGLRDGMGISIG